MLNHSFFKFQEKLIFYETYALSLWLTLIGHNINCDLFVLHMLLHILYM